MKSKSKIWLPLVLASLVGGGVYAKGQVDRMKEAAGLLQKTTRNFRIHAINTQAQSMELHVDLVFFNPTGVKLTLSDLVIRVYHRLGTDQLLVASRPTGDFTIAPNGDTVVPLRFSAALGSGLLTALTSVFDNKPTEFVLEVIPGIQGIALPPLQESHTITAREIARMIAGGGMNGLGMTQQGKKRLKPLTPYLKYFNPKHRKAGSRILKYGSTYDTMREMDKMVKRTLHHTKEISQVLKGKTDEESTLNVFNFVNDHIKYEPDKKGREQLRTPARLIADGKGDCDCYTVFIRSCLTNMGILNRNRKTGYDPNADYQHIYAVAQPKRQVA